MCGRFALFSNIEVILKYADLVDNNIEWSPHYNVSPGMVMPLLISNGKITAVDYLKWGLIPEFSYQKDKDTLFSIINAKAETIASKPSFKHAFKKRRCLVPANGFYEWRKTDKQPFYITIKSLPLIFFAGIWNNQKDDILGNFAIITTQANNKLQPIHDRMPVIIHPKRMNEWLHSGNHPELTDLLLPYPDEEIDIQPVSREVNYSKIDHAGLIERLENL